jgi:hypothetical protein
MYVNWFQTIFEIYQINDDTGERVASCENLLKLYLHSGLEQQDALLAYKKITNVTTFKSKIKDTNR